MLGWEIIGAGCVLYFGYIILREGVIRYGKVIRKD